MPITKCTVLQVNFTKGNLERGISCTNLGFKFKKSLCYGFLQITYR